MKPLLSLLLIAGLASADPELDRLFDQLQAEDPAERDAAEKALVALGDAAGAEARRRLEGAAGELRGRLEAVLAGLEVARLGRARLVLEREIRLGGGNTHSVEFSPDGRLLATGGDTGDIVLWDPETETALAVLRGHPHWVGGLAFDPGGKRLASAGDDVVVWDVEKRVELRRFEEERVTVVAWSPDGATIAWPGDGELVLADGASLKVRRRIARERAVPDALAFSRDGKKLAAGDRAGEVNVYSAETGETLSTSLPDSGKDGDHIRDVAFLDDATVAVAFDGGKLWLGAVEKSLRAIRAMRVSKDGSTVALSLADDRLLELSPKGETLRSQAVAGGYALALSPDGKTFALSGHKCALVVKAGEAHELDGHAARVERAVFSRDGLFVAVQGEDTDVVSLLDGSRRERVGVTCLSTGVRKSEFLAAMGPTAVVWDAARGDVTERIRTVSAPRPYARIWRSPDGRLLAISEPFSTPDVYADGSEEPLELPDGLFGTVLGLEFSPDGKHFAVSTVSGNHGESGRLLILTPELKPVFELRTDGAVCPAAWHPDGQSLVWSDLESTTFLRFPSCEKIASEDVVQNWWRFRSASALVSGGSREVQVRHARTRVRAATLPVPDGCAWTVASPDGLRVAAAESDRVRVFRIELEGE